MTCRNFSSSIFTYFIFFFLINLIYSKFYLVGNFNVSTIPIANNNNLNIFVDYIEDLLTNKKNISHLIFFENEINTNFYYTQYLILKILCLFFDNEVLIFKLYFILKNILTYLICFFVLNSFEKNYLKNFFIATILTFIPFNLFEQKNNLFLLSYYSVPLSFLFIKNYNLSLKVLFFKILVCTFILCSGLNYAIYTCVFILFCIIKNLFENKSNVILYISLLIFFLIFTLNYFFLNNVHFAFKFHSFDFSFYTRTEQYFLKLIHMILPIKNHFINILSNTRTYYEILMSAYPGYKSSTALGLFGSITYVFLLLNFLFNFKFLEKIEIKSFENCTKLFPFFVFFSIPLFGVGGIINIVNLNNLYFLEFSSSIVLISLICYTYFFNILFEISKNFKYKNILFFLVFIFVLTDLGGKNFSEIEPYLN